MSGLKRIILIDTHLPGLVELKVDGHTNICGTNASGKTTLQRLLPVFYGEAPNKVVPATRDNFQTWYLPRESSFIIYEYQRLDDKLCMALLTSSNVGVEYRFIEKGFDAEDFITKDLVTEGIASTDEVASLRSLTKAEISKNMRQQNVMVSRALNNKEYRSVIQNDRAVLALSTHKRDLLAAARTFSLCESDARLRHIEKLIKAVHSKEGKMETIKAMIAAILEEDGVETPSNKISKAQVDDWIKECQLIQEFQSLMPSYRSLEKVSASLQHTEQRLSQLKAQLSADLSLLSDSIVKAEQDNSAYKQQLSDVKSNFEQQRDEQNRTLSMANAEVKSAEQHLDQIEDKFNEWQDLDIETHQANLDKIDNWKVQLESNSQQHALLTQEHQDIEASFHKREADIEKKHSKQLAQLNQQKDKGQEQLDAQQKQERQALSKLKASQDARLIAINSDFDRQINDNQLKLQTLKTEIELSGPSAEEQQEMALQENNLEHAQSDEDHTRNEFAKLNEQLQTEKYQQIAANEKLNKSRAKIKAENQRLAEVQSWLDPANNSLLDFLRNNLSGWEQNLGKVISPELLARTDLSPAIDDQGSNSIFGVLLDTDVINESDLVQTEEQLKAQLLNIEEELKNAQIIHLELEQELATFNAAVKQTEQKCTQLQSQCQFKQDTRKRIQDERNQLKEQHKQALQERKQQRLDSLQGVENRTEKLVNNKESAIEEHQSQCHDEKMEHELHWQQLIGGVEQKVSSIKSQIADAESQYKQNLKACKKWYQDELNNRDVDVKQISELKQSISELQDNIAVTNKYRDKVSEYASWYELVFTKQKAGYLTQLSAAKESKSKTERLQAELLTNYQQQQQQLQKQLEQLQKALNEQRELSSGITTIKQQIATMVLPKATVATENSTAAARLVEARELIDNQRKASKDIEEFVSYFDNAIGQKSGLSLTETWERARQDCLVENAQGLTVLDSRKMVTELETLLTILVPQHLAGVRNNGLTFGNNLNQYYNLLADIDKRIASQSRRISKEVEHELFLDGVSESSVKIRSKISEFDFWPKLLSFNKLYSQWASDESAELPDDEYMQTMREVLDVLGRATMSGGISQLLDIELHLKEGNSELVIRTDRQLNESSSHGMAYLILCKFLLAFTRMLVGKSEVIIHWPIDEIGTLANKNVKKIFDACKENNIHVLGAFPNPESDVLHFFQNRYLIEKNPKEKQRLRIVEPKVSRISELIKQRKETEKSA